MSTSAPFETGQATARLSTLDRFLPVRIFAATAVAQLPGRLVPGIGLALYAVTRTPK